MPTTGQITNWRGQDVVDRDDDRFGKVEQIHLDAPTGEER
jgi:hypothetical protein